MQIHNETGYAPKQINVFKALLYDAMPAGSILIVPDSLWNSPFWASMLLGNALRGGRVYIISPALANAPSAGFPQMSRAQELYSQLVVVKQTMAAEIAHDGGSLNLGIYAVNKDVGDLHGRIELFYDKVMSNPFMLDFFDVPEGDSERRRASSSASRGARPRSSPGSKPRASIPATWPRTSTTASPSST